MRLRLYYLCPDLPSARKLADDLLLARIEDRRMHFLGKRGTDYGDLHEASVLQKTGIVHGAETGLALGGLLGAAIGGGLVLFPLGNGAMEPVTILIAALAGALIGAWIASMAGTQIGNSRLKKFERAIEAGNILLMVDVSMLRVAQIRELLSVPKYITELPFKAVSLIPTLLPWGEGLFCFPPPLGEGLRVRENMS